VSIKDNKFYAFYQIYLKTLNISEAKKKLLSISENFFNDFINKWENKPLFRAKYELVFKKLIRDEKLKNLLEIYDTENKLLD
jgi:hypothetical protein